MSAVSSSESCGTNASDTSNSTRYLCPYYIYDSLTTHMNWCRQCKQPFHTKNTLETHEKAGGCSPQEEYPVGYLNKAIKDESLSGTAVAGMTYEQKLRNIFVTLFKCEPPAGNYYKFYGPPHSEAYGQAKLEAALVHIEMVIKAIGDRNPQYKSMMGLFENLLKITSEGPRSPSDDQRRGIARLASEKARGGLRALPLPSIPLPHAVLPSLEDVEKAQLVLDHYLAFDSGIGINSQLQPKPGIAGYGYTSPGPSDISHHQLPPSTFAYPLNHMFAQSLAPSSDFLDISMTDWSQMYS
ncbi:hypothetical protein HOO65_060298 [Ceratocystis lukuohia]|uniref:C2H2-type domain-containing protein n=1 Tax=Ceratocystis lukuohia TaxID=2019550 RepID=A0ABR4ME04_9PEZI